MDKIFGGLLSSLNYPLFIVTTADGGRREGCVIGFATQTSIHPGRFLACLSRENRTQRLAQEVDALAVHLVPREQRALVELFGGETGDEVDKFARCDWSPGPRGLPILAACPSWFAGAILSRHDLGDHEGYLLEAIEAHHEPGELLYFQDVQDLEPGHDPVTAARNEPAAVLRRLLPDGGSLTADEAAAQLDFGAWAPEDRPYVAVNMVATVDGRASVAGRTAPISSVADRQLFHALRTRVDAVMVGAGTLRTERYGRIVRDPHRREQRVAAGLEADPVAIVISGRLDLPGDLPLLEDAHSRVIVVTAAEHALEDCAAQVSYVRRSPIDLGEALTTVRAEHGVRSILCEGGPHLNASLFAAGLADELFLTTFPTLAGGAGALTIIGDAPLAEPLDVRMRWLLECEGELFARYRLGG